MNDIKAIGFDLFNTLITVEFDALEEALGRLTGRLAQDGIRPEYEPFKKAYRASAIRFIKEARRVGKETHNRFWISEALHGLGHEIGPEDPRIASAIEAYFSAFLDYSHLVPGTEWMLEKLKGQFRLGLLSNFTHAPAARKIIDHVGLTPYFDIVLISGQIGYRKPHPFVFQELENALGVHADETVFVGDDPEADIDGARRAGFRPVITTYARDNKSPLPPGVASDQMERVDPSVPAISIWEELLDFLENEMKGLQA